MKLQVLVGMIASGKTTYCRNAAKKGFLCVNDDAIVNMLHGEDYTLYDPKLKILYKSIESQAIGTGLAMGRTVIVDRGLNLDSSGRARWISMARSYDVPCEAIVFNKVEPEVHASRRIKSDSRGRSYEYWLDVAKMHAARYVEPTFDEGFSSIQQISFEQIDRGFVYE